MKNSAVRAMIKNQFSWVDNISVEFIAATGQQEEYKISIDDDGNYREFKLLVELQEIES